MAVPEKKLALSLKKQILFSAIILCVVLIAGEVALRTWVFFLRTSYERYDFTTGRLELVPGIRQVLGNGEQFIINSKGFLGPEFSDVPREDIDRIIAIGDSCTFSDGIWTHAYPAILENLLNSRDAKRRYEIINGGIEGYNSTFALDRIKQEIIKYQPRLVVIYIGWNDLMKTNPDNLSATGKYTFVSRIIEQSYLVKAYSKLMFQYLRPLIFQPKDIAGGEKNQSFENFVPRTYEDNLKAAISVLREHDIKIILTTLPTVVYPQMTREEIKKQKVFFPYFAGTYSVTEFLGLLRSYNNVIRSVGTNLDVPVVDLDRIVNHEGEKKSRLFWDTMHPSREGQTLVANSLYPIVQRELNGVLTGR